RHAVVPVRLRTRRDARGPDQPRRAFARVQAIGLQAARPARRAGPDRRLPLPNRSRARRTLMSRVGISRRTFLRGAAGVAVGLPLLDGMGCSSRVAGTRSSARSLSGAPKRLVIFFSPDGVNPPDWWPSGSETSFQLSPTLAPLAAHQQDLIIVKGVDMTSAMNDPSGVDSGHQKPMGHMLTGTAVYAQGGVVSGGGISVDQAIANQIGANTKFGSLEMGVMTFSGNT